MSSVTLLNVGVCCNLLLDHVLKSGSKGTEITGRGIRTFGRVIHNLAAVVPLRDASPVGSMGHGDFRIFGPLKEHSAGE